MNIRSKRQPTKGKQIENIFIQLQNEVRALQVLFYQHMKDNHNLTDEQVKEFYGKVLNPKKEEPKTELKTEIAKVTDLMK